MRKILFISSVFVCALSWFLAANGQGKPSPIEYKLNANERWEEDFDLAGISNDYKIYRLAKDPRVVMTLGIENGNMQSEFSKAEINAYAAKLMKAKNFITDTFNMEPTKLVKASNCKKDGIECLSLEMEQEFKSGTFKLMDKYFMAGDRTIIATLKWPKGANDSFIKTAIADYQNIDIVKVK